MTWSKKAQAGAAILVALIAILIILYVLFLPGPERAALLGEQTGTTGVNGGKAGTGNLVFSAPVGRVVVPLQPSVTHDLPSVPIRAIEQGSVLASRDTLQITNNVFAKEEPSILFTASPSLTRNPVLSLNVASRTRGALIVELNGQEIYRKEPTSRSIPPITLSNLQETNTLVFKASTVGFAFWHTNRITATGVKVTADVTDLSAASAKQRFTIGDEELKVLDKATLSFTPACQAEGPITIQLNDLAIYDGMPDCSGPNTLEIAPARLVAGENMIAWSTKKADLVVDNAKITTMSKQRENQAFSFMVNPAQVQGKPIMLRIYFADSRSKTGVVMINGNSIPIQGGDAYALPITTSVKPGTNAIRFEARGSDFEIVKFEIIAG